MGTSFLSPPLAGFRRRGCFCSLSSPQIRQVDAAPPHPPDEEDSWAPTPLGGVGARFVKEPLRLEAEPSVAPHDMAGGRSGEVSTDHPDRLVAIALDEGLARFSTHRWIGVEFANPVRMGDLNRMVDHVAGNDRVLAARRNPHARVTRGMPGSRFEYDVASSIDGHCPPVPRALLR